MGMTTLLLLSVLLTTAAASICIMKRTISNARASADVHASGAVGSFQQHKQPSMQRTITELHQSTPAYSERSQQRGLEVLPPADPWVSPSQERTPVQFSSMTKSSMGVVDVSRPSELSFSTYGPAGPHSSAGLSTSVGLASVAVDRDAAGMRVQDIVDAGRLHVGSTLHEREFVFGAPCGQVLLLETSRLSFVRYARVPGEVVNATALGDDAVCQRL